MGFNRRDLQDNDDDDFNFDDFDSEAGDAKDDFSFDDEPADVGLDDDSGFGFEDEDMPPIEEEEVSEGQGINRTFIIIAALMIGVFVIGLIVLLVIVSQPRPPTPNELTATYIVEQNATTQALLVATQTAAVEIANATGTAAVLIAQAETATAQVPPTDTPMPTDTPTPTLDPTQLAEEAFITQTAVAQAMFEAQMTQTAEFLLTPPTQGALPIGAIEQTATALAILIPLPTAGQGGGEIPTQEGLPTSGVLVTPGFVATALPDTGFFDDLAAGGTNVGTFALMALGLLAVVVISRRLRATNNR